MNRENMFLKYLFYIASAAAAWSRVNDDAHYMSQAALGWYMAWESVDSVFDTDEKHKKLSITPIVGKNSYGIFATIRW